MLKNSGLLIGNNNEDVMFCVLSKDEQLSEALHNLPHGMRTPANCRKLNRDPPHLKKKKKQTLPRSFKGKKLIF